MSPGTSPQELLANSFEPLLNPEPQVLNAQSQTPERIQARFGFQILGSGTLDRDGAEDVKYGLTLHKLGYWAPLNGVCRVPDTPRNPKPQKP